MLPAGTQNLTLSTRSSRDRCCETHSRSDLNRKQFTTFKRPRRHFKSLGTQLVRNQVLVTTDRITAYVLIRPTVPQHRNTVEGRFGSPNMQSLGNPLFKGIDAFLNVLRGAQVSTHTELFLMTGSDFCTECTGGILRYPYLDVYQTVSFENPHPPLSNDPGPYR